MEPCQTSSTPSRETLSAIIEGLSTTLVRLSFDTTEGGVSTLPRGQVIRQRVWGFRRADSYWNDCPGEGGGGGDGASLVVLQMLIRSVSSHLTCQEP